VQVFRRIGTVIDTLSRWLAFVAGVSICVIMVLMTADAMSRKVIGTVVGAYETSIALLALVVLLPQGYTQLHRGHTQIDILSSHFPKKVQLILGGVASILGAIMLGLLAWLGWERALYETLSNEVWVGIIDYPAWPWRWAIPLGCGVITLQLLKTAIEDFKQLKSWNRSK
jgi:TRAP-type C4-dicarboxylate transport system permease small subunit